MRLGGIEDLNRKRALLFLTCELHAVLEFLGLDTEAYKRPFESVESMYRYVCGCRCFSDERYLRGELKANDRKRMAQRELYRTFIQEWLPENAHLVRQQKEQNAQISRDSVLEDSLNKFGKEKIMRSELKNGERRERDYKQSRREDKSGRRMQRS